MPPFQGLMKNGPASRKAFRPSSGKGIKSSSRKSLIPTSVLSPFTKGKKRRYEFMSPQAQNSYYLSHHKIEDDDSGTSDDVAIIEHDNISETLKASPSTHSATGSGVFLRTLAEKKFPGIISDVGFVASGDVIVCHGEGVALCNQMLEVKKTLEGIHLPGGVDVVQTDGSIVVVDRFADTLNIFSEELIVNSLCHMVTSIWIPAGDPITSFQAGSSPMDVCVTDDGQYLVTDISDKCVHALRADDSSLRHRVPTGGDGYTLQWPLYIHYLLGYSPRGPKTEDAQNKDLAVSRGHVIVSDTMQRKLLLFDDSGGFIHELCLRVPSAHHLLRPRGLCTVMRHATAKDIISHYVIVVDDTTDCVECFNLSDESHVKTLIDGHSDIGTDRNLKPKVVCASPDNEYLIVGGTTGIVRVAKIESSALTESRARTVSANLSESVDSTATAGRASQCVGPAGYKKCLTFSKKIQRDSSKYSSFDSNSSVTKKSSLQNNSFDSNMSWLSRTVAKQSTKHAAKVGVSVSKSKKLVGNTQEPKVPKIRKTKQDSDKMQIKRGAKWYSNLRDVHEKLNHDRVSIVLNRFNSADIMNDDDDEDCFIVEDNTNISVNHDIKNLNNIVQGEWEEGEENVDVCEREEVVAGGEEGVEGGQEEEEVGVDGGQEEEEVGVDGGQEEVVLEGEVVWKEEAVLDESYAVVLNDEEEVVLNVQQVGGQKEVIREGGQGVVMEGGVQEEYHLGYNHDDDDCIIIDLPE